MSAFMKTLHRRVALTLALLFILVASGTRPNAATKALLKPSDLRYRGTYAFPLVGTPTAGGAGTTNYASGAIAVRYVGGERRFLMPLFANMDPTTGALFGDLVEWREPTGATPYVGSDPSLAPKMVETRRWRNWTMLATTPAWQETNSGVRIGGLFWDEANGVLWYQLYGYYSGKNEPLLAATRLLDSTSSGYSDVGPKYGPWWYRNNNPADTSLLYWKAACNWIAAVPAGSQPDLQGNTMILGGTVGAVGGAGNVGPGFRAIPRLPSLSDPPNSVIPLGLRLADYTNESPIRPFQAHRDTNYRFDGVPYSSSDSGLVSPTTTTGYWQMSLDQVNSFIWVDAPTVEGILLFGRESTGLNWYGHNPRSTTPGGIGTAVDATDPTRQLNDSNGYGSTAWKPALYVFDPAQVREVGRGARSPWTDGINPVAIYDWGALYPTLPRNQFVPASTATQARPIESNISNTGFWDATTKQVIWVQPDSVGPTAMQPTLNLFSVQYIAPPTNLSIVR